MAADSPRACTADFTAALIRRDIDAALALLADDVVLFFSNGSVVRGKEAFAATMVAGWAVLENYKYRLLDSVWVAESDAVATIIYDFEWSGFASGNDVGGAGRGTRVFVRTAPGWLLAHEHLSAGRWGS